MLRGSLEGIYHSQVKIELRKTIRDKELNNANALERALQLEDLTRNEE